MKQITTITTEEMVDHFGLRFKSLGQFMKAPVCKKVHLMQELAQYMFVLNMAGDKAWVWRSACYGVYFHQLFGAMHPDFLKSLDIPDMPPDACAQVRMQLDEILKQKEDCTKGSNVVPFPLHKI